MTFLHTSDWHLGQQLHSYDRDDEHRHFFAQLCEIMQREQPDALIVSGDIFHTAAPSAQAMRLFVEGVVALHDASPRTVIVITAGNHDSGNRLNSERLLWQRLGIHIVGTVDLDPEDHTFDPKQLVIQLPGIGYILAAPYFHPSYFPTTDLETPREERQRAFYAALLEQVSGSDVPVVLMAHTAVEGCDLRGHDDMVIGGISTEGFDTFGSGYDYLALGHIHMPQQLSDRAWYSGTPVAVSFSEDYTHSVNLVEIEAHGYLPKVQKLSLGQLRRTVTLPQEGAPLDEALALLEAFDSEDDSYVRLLIDQPQPLDADAQDRARKIAATKKCRFCGVVKKPHESAATASQAIDIDEMADFRQIDPVDIAQKSFQRTKNVALDAQQLELLRHAIYQVIL